MNPEVESDSESGPGVYFAPLEKVFDKILTPFEEFIHRQTTSSLLLMTMAATAMVLANSALAYDFDHLLHTLISINIGSWELELSLQHWVNDALMALFFFVVGLELKREFLVGELADTRNALLPIAAAVGGMVVPALIYFSINPEGDAAAGWGVPMATDIAFAIGALALLGSRVPKGLVTFLIALAIVDDLGAVLVIAIFYTETIEFGPLLAAAVLVGVLVTLNAAGTRRIIPYFVIAIVLWYALMLSGLHATLAGVIGAMTVPAKPKYDPQRFSERVRELMQQFDDSIHQGRSIMTNTRLRALVQTLENGVRSVETPLQRLEYIWHAPVAYLVIPIFALVNAGTQLSFATLGETITHPVTLGIMLGLVLGKFLGITGAAWLVLRLGVARLPKATRFSQIAGAGMLAGIGFTMSIFVAQLGFSGREDLLLAAKTGILLASLTAGIAGFIWLYMVSDSRRVEATVEPSRA